MVICNCGYVSREYQEGLQKELYSLRGVPTSTEKSEAISTLAEKMQRPDDRTRTGHIFFCEKDLEAYDPGEHYTNIEKSHLSHSVPDEVWGRLTRGSVNEDTLTENQKKVATVGLYLQY